MLKMYKTAFAVGAFLLLPLSAFCQEETSVKARCETIIASSLAKSVQKLEDAIVAGTIQSFSHAHELRRARLVPSELVEDVLVESLNSKDTQIRFTAAEVLIQFSPMQFEEVIRNSLEPLELTSSKDKVQRAAIFMKLDDDDAKAELRHWAKHQFNQLGNDDWICPMMCIKPSKEAGKCSICKMNKVKKSRNPDQNDWEATLFALQQLQETGDPVQEDARSILVSNAPPFVRAQAAGLWTKENADDALPHLAIFLHSDNPYIAVELLADLVPKKFVVQFDQLVGSAKPGDELTVLAAHRGMLRAGEMKYLATIRQWVDSPAQTESEEFNKVNGIYLLGELGLREDLNRLEKLLDTRFKIAAAETLLQVYARKSKSRNR